MYKTLYANLVFTPVGKRADLIRRKKLSAAVPAPCAKKVRAENTLSARAARRDYEAGDAVTAEHRNAARSAALRQGPGPGEGGGGDGGGRKRKRRAAAVNDEVIS